MLYIIMISALVIFNILFGTISANRSPLGEVIASSYSFLLSKVVTSAIIWETYKGWTGFLLTAVMFPASRTQKSRSESRRDEEVKFS